MSYYFFFYGTLRDADVLARVLPGASGLTKESQVLEGYRMAVVRNRPYPGIIASPGSTVTGEVVGPLSEEEKNLLIAYEGEEYRLAVVTVANRKTYVFILRDPRQLSQEMWHLRTFQEREKDRFLLDELEG